MGRKSHKIQRKQVIGVYCYGCAVNDVMQRIYDVALRANDVGSAYDVGTNTAN